MQIFSRHIVHVWNYNYHIIWRDKLSIYVKITLDILFFLMIGMMLKIWRNRTLNLKYKKAT